MKEKVCKSIKIEDIKTEKKVCKSISMNVFASDEFSGRVIDEELAKKSKCYKHPKKVGLIYKKGIIGVLNKKQIEEYCPEFL